MRFIMRDRRKRRARDHDERKGLMIKRLERRIEKVIVRCM